MITTFEDETHGLTGPELIIIPVIVKSFNKRVGKENIITGAEICENLNRYCRENSIKMKFKGARIRKIVHYIVINRMTRLPLIATSKGYYTTDNQAEIDLHAESLLDRMDAIKVRYDSVKNWKFLNN